MLRVKLLIPPSFQIGEEQEELFLVLFLFRCENSQSPNMMERRSFIVLKGDEKVKILFFRSSFFAEDLKKQ